MGDMWQERTSHLSKFDQTGRERGKEGKRKREKRESKRRREREREALPFFYFSRRSDRRRSSEQEAKFVLAARASNRDQNLGFSPSSER